jgi:LPXTG-site transpeptidase (sortase) family protein
MNLLKNMQLKTLSKRTLLIVALAGVALPAALQSSIQGNSVLLVKSSVVTIKQEQASFGLPVHLKIPGITVDTTIEYIGVTPEGDMGAPKGPTGVAWFNLGPRPGELGSAVISGHYGWKNGIAAVFDNLHKLQKGDKLYIEDEKGTITTFVVRELRRYGENENASDVFNSNDGKAHLNLVTCEGVWNKSSKSYSKRLVVFTDKE